VAGTSVSVTFDGKSSVTIPVGEEIYSDAVSLRFADNDTDDDFLKQRLSRNGEDAVLADRKLASFLVNERSERTALRTPPGVQLDRKVAVINATLKRWRIPQLFP
jgi:hypothetical protein